MNKKFKGIEKIKVGIMGCTGLVGQQFVKMLSHHPYFEISCLTASPKSEKKKYNNTVNWRFENKIPSNLKDSVIEKTCVETFLRNKVKIVFSALPSPVAKNIEIELRNSGIYVFSNSSAHRMDEEIPIIIPEVNSEHFELAKKQKNKYGGFIVTNSNCTTFGLVLSLKPIIKFGIKSIIVSTYQSVSGAGRKGVAGMEILGNIIPYIKGEEEKIVKETGKILGEVKNGRIVKKNIEIIANCCRVPVNVGHLESITIEFEKEIDLQDFEESLKNFKSEPQRLKLPSAPENPIIISKENNRPQPYLDSKNCNGMAITVGRIRKKNNKISFFLLINNLVRGAAGTSILNAEYALKKKIIEV